MVEVPVPVPVPVVVGEVGELPVPVPVPVLVDAELARRTRQQKQTRSSARTVTGRMVMQVVSCHKLHEMCKELEIMRAYIRPHRGMGVTAAARCLLYTAGVH